MALRKGSLEIKNRILSVCAKLFIEQGYHDTPISQIIKEAQISVSSFQNIFHTKDGVLMEFVRIMFGGQFAAAESMTLKVPPVYIYAVETAIQLAITEQNENLREIYLEAYSLPHTSEYIYEHTAIELYKIFGANFPEYTENDFYQMDIGTSGIMRGYMAKKCDIHFPFEKKLERFLQLTLGSYRVPEDEIVTIIAYINGMNIKAIADNVMQGLIRELTMQFETN